MRRRIIALAAAGLLALTGCASDPGPSSDPSSAAAGSSLADVELSGAGPGEAAPTAEFEAPLAIVGDGEGLVVSEGDGAEVADGGWALAQFTQWDATTGEIAGSTYDENAPQLFVVDDQSLAPALYEVLDGATVGSRLLLGLSTAGAADGSTGALVVLDVVDAGTSLRAEGDPVAPAEGLPTVTLAENGAPTITVPAGAVPPADLQVQTLLRGAGEQVSAGDTVVVEYTGALYADGTVFDTSWNRDVAGTGPAPTAFSLDAVVEGWSGLVGQTVGSQVLLVIPPALGYGDQEQTGIPANSTLVFVVDILGTYTGPALDDAAATPTP